MRQLGDCWGTLLGMRGFSDGESFVQRNVGLKSVWRDGDWRVRVIVQDHDDLTVAGVGPRYISPWREVSGMQRDEVHILGGSSGTSSASPATRRRCARSTGSTRTSPTPASRR